ncbi:restriction endonuclease subunit S [Isoptericola sp. NPDC057391]|uniref:restriction endonuclease subunit S n=1 Tax=Isoptericola sp. NPDC057391 TaxID=3346117 RepID=UPI003637EDD9
MSRIDDAIEQYAPDGVEYTPLGDVAVLQRGTSITKKGVRDGSVPVVAGGRSAAYYHAESNRDGETIVVAGSGAYAGFVSWWEGPIFVSDAFSVKPRGDDLLAKYAYYWLASQQDRLHSDKRGSGVPHVYAKDVARYLIPVPPVEVQQEIVRILDAFRELEAELKAELSAREEQYSHYRDTLISRTGVGNVKWATMREIGSIYGGLTGKSKTDFTDGNAPFISYMNVFSNLATDLTPKTLVKVMVNERQTAVAYGDVLFTASSESREEVGMASAVTAEPSESTYLNSFCFGFRPNSTDELDPAFAKHLFRARVMRDQIVKTANGVTRINISKGPFAKMRVPLPDIGEQKQIADVLDKFDALVNDLSSGLPAEIEARRKQYAHYRDRLLSFPEKPEGAAA